MAATAPSITGLSRIIGSSNSAITRCGDSETSMPRHAFARPARNKTTTFGCAPSCANVFRPYQSNIESEAGMLFAILALPCASRSLLRQMLLHQQQP